VVQIVIGCETPLAKGKDPNS